MENFLKRKFDNVEYRGVGIFEGLDRALQLSVVAVFVAGVVGFGVSHPEAMPKILVHAAAYAVNPVVGAAHAALSAFGVVSW